MSFLLLHFFGITPALPSPRLTPNPVAIEIQMRAIAGMPSTHGRSTSGTGFAAIRVGARARCCAGGPELAKV
jgi:hypothetical protein